MESNNTIREALAAVCNLTLAQLEKRLAELEAERAQLSTLRRSLVARERAKRRANQCTRKPTHHDLTAQLAFEPHADPAGGIL
jgi:hypothetical protein